MRFIVLFSSSAHQSVFGLIVFVLVMLNSYLSFRPHYYENHFFLAARAFVRLL